MSSVAERKQKLLLSSTLSCNRSSSHRCKGSPVVLTFDCHLHELTPITCCCFMEIREMWRAATKTLSTYKYIRRLQLNWVNQIFLDKCYSGFRIQYSCQISAVFIFLYILCSTIIFTDHSDSDHYPFLSPNANVRIWRPTFCMNNATFKACEYRRSSSSVATKRRPK